MNNLIDTREIESAFNDLISELENIKDLNKQVEEATVNSKVYLHSSENYRKGTEQLTSKVQDFYEKYRVIDDELRYLLQQNSTILDNLSSFFFDFGQQFPQNLSTEITKLKNTVDSNKVYHEELLNMKANSLKELLDKLRREISDNQSRNHTVFSTVIGKIERDTTHIFVQINKTIQLNTSLLKQIEDNHKTTSDVLKKITELNIAFEQSKEEQTTHYNNIINRTDIINEKQTDFFNTALQKISKKLDIQAQRTNKVQKINLTLNAVLIAIGSILILLGFNIF